MSSEYKARSRTVAEGRAAYDQRRWADALDAFRRARHDGSLDAGDVDRMVWSAALGGDDEAFIGALEQLHELCVEGLNPRLAARAAFWIGFRLLSVGEPARAMGWLARAERHIESESDGCPEKGYLLLPTVFRQLAGNENESAERTADEAATIGTRCGDLDLVAISRGLRGRALIRQGRVEAGLTLLDEVMVAVTADELSPMMTGVVYCSVIATCQQICAVDRAREWTSALASWCDEQPQLVNFTGSCLVHRSEIMQLGGDWPQAQEAARLVCDGVCRDRDPEVLADACYQRGEILRLRGQLSEAEAAYRLANQNGRDPQPGLALLRLAQGRVEEAAKAVNRLLVGTKPTWKRARLLPAFFEIMLASNDLVKGRAAAEELTSIAERFGTEILGAMAAQARGALELEQGEPGKAIEQLTTAFRVWHRVGAPYITARIRVLLSRAYGTLGDIDGAKLELDAARRVFEELGAAADLAALARAGEHDGAGAPSHGLSSRELEVLRLVATGKTNKRIAAELFVSERTVDRHVSNIFTKLGVSSRAAATAFAYENDLT